MPDNDSFPSCTMGEGADPFRECVCIDVEKIYDSCKDKDCIEDIRVFISANSQQCIESAISVKPKHATVIHTDISVEPIRFKRGYFSVDVQFYIKVVCEAAVSLGRPNEIEGLCVFNKKSVLFGSDGGAKIYSSKFAPCGACPMNEAGNNLPTATVEVIDPVMLGSKVIEPCECGCCCRADLSFLPECILSAFDSPLTDAENCKKLFVSLGLFSLLRLKRRVQLVIPAYSFCVPSKESEALTEDDPCSVFRTMDFPTDEFFPPVMGEDAL